VCRCWRLRRWWSSSLGAGCTLKPWPRAVLVAWAVAALLFACVLALWQIRVMQQEQLMHGQAHSKQQLQQQHRAKQQRPKQSQQQRQCHQQQQALLEEEPREPDTLQMANWTEHVI